MELYTLLFWVFFGIIFYTFIGYGIVLYGFVLIKRILFKKKNFKALTDDELPEVTLIIPAYNERDYVDQKMRNSLSLDYPADKLKIVWITDGSNDGTNLLLENYDSVQVFHRDERKGKINAMNRVMPFISSPISVFSDANTDLGLGSIKHIVNCFRDEKVGCVSGEKRIIQKSKDSAAGSGEGLYWRYESLLKKWDAELYSIVGAAGELFAIRTSLFHEVEPDTILDDFIISLRVAQKGYTIQYNPEAYAIEFASQDVKEELKRKVRIAAGGIQSIIRLRSLFNVFKYRMLSFQFISHRVLRWTITPLALVALLLTTLTIAVLADFSVNNFYVIMLLLQIAFYFLALVGWFFEKKSIRFKALFVPYYFVIMNLSVILGMFRYAKGNQSVNWERSKRAI